MTRQLRFLGLHQGRETEFINVNWSADAGAEARENLREDAGKPELHAPLKTFSGTTL
jgi:hypothetical protein